MRMHFIAVLVILVSVAAGCQKDEPLPPHQAATPVTETASTSTSTTETTSSAVTATPASSPAPPPGGAVATTEGEQSGVSLTVTEFKRGSGGTATLKFTIVNGGTQPLNFGYGMADPANSNIDYNTVGGVHLIDPVNKKKYFVVRDSDNRCVCSRDLKPIEPGGRLTLWAKFPAPDVQRVTLIVPHFIPMDDVPIS